MIKILTLPFIFQICVSALTSELCTDISLLSLVQDNSELTVAPFLTLNDTGLIQCARECLLRARCRSFNFDFGPGHCRLLDITSDQTAESDLVNVKDSVHSDIDSWPSRLAGNCSGHLCPNNTVCEEAKANYSCTITHCVDPPTVYRGVFKEATKGKKFWAIGEELSYMCDAQYIPIEPRICQADGIWSTFYCHPVGDCGGVKKCNDSYPDGEYWILLTKADKAQAKVYCHDMMSDSPTTYISLIQENYSFSPDTCETCGKTTYSKVRLSAWSLTLKLRDTTFAVSSGSCEAAQFGSVSGCGRKCGDEGTLQIDLSGTGYSIGTESRWASRNGTKVDVRPSNDWTVVRVACLEEDCTDCYPVDKTGDYVKTLDVVVNTMDQPPQDSATTPVCN